MSSYAVPPLLLALSASVLAPAAEAAQLIPKSDVEVGCYRNGEPAYACDLNCGGGYSLSVDGVRRIEIYANGKAGRPDQRVWLAVERKQGGRQDSPTLVEVMYLTSINACNWTTPKFVGTPPARIEMRFEKFDQ